jgi:hypothetical protein
MSTTPLAAPPPEHCPGVNTENSGKADACKGCANQSICATAPKGPDPGTSTIIILFDLNCQIYQQLQKECLPSNIKY